MNKTTDIIFLHHSIGHCVWTGASQPGLLPEGGA